jgi:Holliday junction resolvasome RuvABC endonuclease subunit
VKCLGLDISTSCTGWSVTNTDESGNVIEVTLGKIILDEFDDLIGKANEVVKHLSVINSLHKIDKIYIEENMQAFRPGASSAQTLVKLAKFNGIVTYLSHHVTGLTPVAVNVNHARKILGINLKREKVCGISTKDQIYSWVSAHPLLVSYDWPHRVIASGPRKGQRVLESYVYDMSDAFVIAMSGPIIHT